jgi:GNAT superfamily N-acetyltransferase
MTVKIESPRDARALREFLRFFDRVYERRPVRWPAFVSFDLSVLSPGSPYLPGRSARPMVARQGGDVVARAMAVLDRRYNEHWNETLGHIALFEALPHAQEATRRLIDTASAWLAEQGATAARAGYGMMDLPFVIDDYESLPPTVLRHNPPYYHSLLKEAGFEIEKGWVDYRIDVVPELIASWQNALARGQRNGFNVVALKHLGAEQRAADLAFTWNDAFSRHWGHTPTTPAEFLFLLRILETSGVLDASAVAYADGRPVGAVWVVPESSASAQLRPGRTLADSERLNVFAIGVRESARGTGINLALGAHAYLELVRRGARSLSYTLVLDDNWPSRRTAEKLGGHIRANYVTYRRNFR